MAKVKINPSAKKKIEKSAMDICKEYAKEVEEDMSDFFQEQIDEFYNDPAYKDRPPRVYRRHHERKAYPNKPRGLDKTYEKVFKEKERSCEGGIRISTDDMYNTGYHGSTEQVLESFLAGIHGAPKILTSPDNKPKSRRKVITDSSNTKDYVPNPPCGVQPLEASRDYLKELVEDIDKRMKKGGE